MTIVLKYIYIYIFYYWNFLFSFSSFDCTPIGVSQMSCRRFSCGALFLLLQFSLYCFLLALITLLSIDFNAGLS